VIRGYSLPLTPLGRSSLVPPPPWHYVGDFLVIEFWCDGAAAIAALPPGLDPHPTDPGRAAALFVDWQSCTSDRNELVDPTRSQYKEFFIVLNAMLDGRAVTTCPCIWVDQDFALVRGWVQGFPKKLGSVWVTRTFGLDTPADPGVAPGATFAGTLAANDRRLAQATVTLERVTDDGPQHNAPPLVNIRHFPQLRHDRHDQPAVFELVEARSRNRSISAIWQGSATLEVFAAPNEEHTAFRPVRVGNGFRFTFAYTVDDLETLKDLR
jgi:hypothetical protein